MSELTPLHLGATAGILGSHEQFDAQHLPMITPGHIVSFQVGPVAVCWLAPFADCAFAVPICSPDIRIYRRRLGQSIHPLIVSADLQQPQLQQSQHGLDRRNLRLDCRIPVWHRIPVHTDQHVLA